MKVKRKKAKVVMLPRNSNNKTKSTLKKYKIDNSLHYDNNHYLGGDYEHQHLYITVDDEIEKNDYIHNVLFNTIEQCTTPLLVSKHQIQGSQKVIATTDKSLTIDKLVNYGNTGFQKQSKLLPQPSQAFIKKYCELGGIDKVGIELNQPVCQCDTMDKLVKCPFSYDTHGCQKPFNTGDFYGHNVKINSHNEITIYSIKNSWSREEMELKLLEFGNYLRDNYYGVGAPKLIPLTKGLSPGTVEEILYIWKEKNLN